MLMNVAAYLHPERLLVCIWEMDESIPVIHAYKELDPSSDLSLAELGCEQMDLIIHSSDVRLHWFPADGSTDLQERYVFEGTAWFDTPGYSALPAASCATIIYGPTPMHASIQAREPVVERCQKLAQGASIHVDIDLDIQAALECTQPRSMPWLVVGRRGTAWQASLIGTNHLPTASAVFWHDADYTNEAMLSLIHKTMQDRYDVCLDAVMVYGDNVTADQIASMRETWLVDGVRIARSQPFARIRSVLDTQSGQRLLKRAHVVAPLAAIMLRCTTAHA